VKWGYFTADCWYLSDCKLCKDDRGKPQSHWALSINDNQHHSLRDGLKCLGAEGWELVAVQSMDNAGFHSPHLYIFKKPSMG
jgi:hypothetical protein